MSGKAYSDSGYSNSYTPYTITSRGTNSQVGDLLHGSYYYSNGNDSTYYNDGKGSSTCTAPNGNVYKK
ncbi:hypothetical protein QTJ16_006424 [Diplocarpon rosae]|uniref:Uncharacterized protein n=1 Tax=Diplocarpon rosae TaxID=946125 RepID=A0AAD9SX02_9HELO|nr:hypothetical protein QTJ16_006424 [Diplocarpon rosae]